MATNKSVIHSRTSETKRIYFQTWILHFLKTIKNNLNAFMIATVSKLDTCYRDR